MTLYTGRENTVAKFELKVEFHFIRQRNTFEQVLTKGTDSLTFKYDEFD